MKRPLPTRIFNLISDQSLKSLTLTILCMVMSANVSLAQITYAQSECHCLDNATTSTNGQYRETITINAGVTGQTWRLMNPSGLFNTISAAPPAAPIPLLNNTIIPETGVGTGIYQISAIRVSGQNWVVTVTNGSAVRMLLSTQSCAYPAAPATTISGDVNVCPSSTESYSIPASALLSNISWSVPSGGTLVSGQGTNAITVNWGSVSGEYEVTVDAELRSYAGQPNPCDFTTTKVVNISNPGPEVTIRGDFGNCVGDIEAYTLDAGVDELSNIVWTLTTISGTAMGPNIPTYPLNNENRQTIVWPSTPGVYQLTVSGNYVLRNGGTFNSCPFTSTATINVVNEATVALACDNQVQISMNPSCELTFSPDQFLQDQFYPDNSYDIIIRDIQADTIVPSGTLGFDYINKTLEIKVIHECSSNSCWGYAIIEDKSIPVLVCPDDVTITCSDLDNFSVTGYPDLPLGAVRTDIAGSSNTWLLSDYDKCSDVVLTYSDEAETDLCDGPYSSIISRTWMVTDNSGNTATCTHSISVIRADIEDVEFPGNHDSATGPFPSLESCGDWVKITSGDYIGNPSPESTGYPSGTLCLKASVSFTDVKLDVCPNNPMTYKVVRKWTVIDHCTGEIRRHTQFIAVMDTQAPVITCPADLTGQLGPIVNPAETIIVKEHTCGADWNVIPPIEISDCSATTWTVDFLLADGNGRPPLNGVYVKVNGDVRVTGTYPNFKVVNVPLGRTWIRYTVTDACGNFSYCFTEIDAIDNQPPTPVCDKNTIVALGSDGMAMAGVWSFDDGSHDNCTLDYLKVRRMDQSPAWTSLPENNEIKFTCADIGKIIMVELGVWDLGGLTNSCMVEVKVQDNVFPVLTVPAATTANCYDDLTSLAKFGTATVQDNCSATITETRKDELNDCGLGTITRTFTAKDTYGNTVVKTQLITVGNNRLFSSSFIDWPNDFTINSGCINSIDPDDFTVANAYPRYTGNTQCAQLAASYEDIIFNFTDEACTKVLRKWTVIDWCQKVSLFPGSGEWSATQVIMINNTSAPAISAGCSNSDLLITQIADCRANVKVTASAVDDCTPEDKLVWTYTIDEGNNGTNEVSNASGKIIDRNFSYGTHKITWTVKDGCQNANTCSIVFTLADDKKPTPYCISEIVTVLMPTTKEIVIWASDFDLGATDNCSVGNQISSSFSPTNRNDISRIITCDDMDGEVSKSFDLKVYSIDAANNSDFCTVKLVVQDNGNTCGNDPGTANETTIALSGHIYNESDEMIQNVQLELTSNQVEFPKNIMTDVDGTFAFGELPMYKDYAIAPDKNDDPLNGVSTLDLVMIQRHILGFTALETPYKLIAADINGSEKITASDLVELRKMILGIQTTFTNNKSWRFIDVAYQFPDPTSPFPFNEVVQMSNLDHNVAGLDFMAVKIGDVNGSAKNNINNREISIRSTNSFFANTSTGKAGQLVTVTLSTDEISHVVGMQMTFGFDPSKCELVDIYSKNIAISEENLGFGDLTKGNVNVSWTCSSPIDLKEEVMTLKFRLLQDVRDEALVSMDRAYLAPEVYNMNGEGISTTNINLDFGTTKVSDSNQFELFQNVPNPFNTLTNIGFNLPKADQVTFKVFDLTGKLVYISKGQYGKGYNAINLDVSTLNINGVLYYQIDTETHSATRKMIVIK